MQNIEIYSHRGASSAALENTWPAFRKACELGVGIELDVQITKDGVVLVFHDDDLKRLGGRNLRIEEIDYEKIKDLRIGKRGRRKFSADRIPLAYEVFHWAKEKSVPLNIEIKESFAVHSEGPEILAAMLEGLKNIHLSSFNAEILKEMKQLKPEIETALVIKKKHKLQFLDKLTWVDGIHLHKRLYSEKLLIRLNDMKKKIRIYGIVGTEKVVKEPSRHLSGIITDYPGKIKEKMRLPD
ncbi:glycerophosphodiester phosphodiesterase [Planomicrobium okeanokoites]|uniref:glycerophosphodiester phosphodiesterase n=1 Tax=Planomicrobium okeanokoites TaxID=244 RepID=UPI0035617D79